MTTTHIITAAGNRPKPVEVRPPLRVPAGLPPSVLLAHARRVADLTRAVAVAWPATPLYERSRERWVDVLALGVGLSWAHDLGLIEPDLDGWWSLRRIREAVWPVGAGVGRAKAALDLDAPRFDPRWGYAVDRHCPVPGPRGGRCVNRNRQTTRWVTDLETGVWEFREVCPLHWDEVRRRAIDAPVPQPNRGGVLAAVFPEIDVTALYRWARPQWQEPTVHLGPEKPRLRVVVEAS